MDDTEIELLRKLLSNDEVKETLKKILLEESKNIKVERTTKKVAKKTPIKKAVDKKPRAKKSTAKKPTLKKVTDKNSREYGRSYFVDDLTESITETINGKKINLIENSKILSKLVTPPKPRDTIQPPKSKCDQCNAKFIGTGYICDECLRGKNA